MAERIARITTRLPWLVCEENGAVAAYVYASPHRERAAYQWSVDVTVYVGPEHRRTGLGRGLYTSLLRLLVLQGYYKAYAGVTIPNPASEGLHLALGFEPVGIYRGVGYKMGRWHDVAWFQKALQPESLDPAPPRGIQEIRATAAVEQSLQEGLVLVRHPSR
jgi:phosphinothricin acetyltransferase